jgi:hypothetical protein
MSVALGFLGGLLAVGLSGWVTLALEKRRERRANRVAARLVADDLSTASAFLRTMQHFGRWLTPEDGDLRVASWDEGRPLLAASLRNWRDWAQLRHAVWSARTLERITRERLQSGETVLSEEDRRWLRGEAELISGRGFDAVERIADSRAVPLRLVARGRILLSQLRVWRLKRQRHHDEALREFLSI